MPKRPTPDRGCGLRHLEDPWRGASGEVAQTLGATLPCEDFDTFNGLIFGAMATIPEDGSTIEVETAGLVIRVTEIRNHQVVTAVVCLAEPQNTEKQEHNRGEHE